MTVQNSDDPNRNSDPEDKGQDPGPLETDQAQPEPGEPDSVEALEAELQSARQEAGEARNDMLRMKADMDNLRKRLVREHEKARRRALERFMSDLLPVVDSVDRGLDAAADPSATVEALREGKELIRKMLSKTLGDHGLQVIDPQGEPFDPEKHEAMTMVPSDEYDENTVVEVLEKGYQLHDRLIRPAKVVVSRKP